VLWLTRNLTRIPVQRRPPQRPTTSGRFRPCPKVSAFRGNAAFLFRLSGLPASRLFWRSRSSQAIMSPAIPSRIKSDAPCMA
jgi:hypothetical protein